MARRDIWLLSDRRLWRVRGRIGGDDGQEVSYDFSDEASARSMVDRTGQYMYLLCVAAAAVIPGIGAATTRSQRALLAVRLRPLRSAVREVFPSPRPDDEAVPRSTAQAIISDLTAKDYLPANRMVIDIRDGYLEMRPWRDADVMATARLAAQQADLSGATLDATVEAATVACALRDKQAGRRPAKPGE
jgi:hypothetical protein